MAKRVSLADIAESLNVSKSTVSFVLNGKAKQFNISQSTQDLILAKAKELNYVPNVFAKGLREGKTRTVGLVLADISNPFYSQIGKIVQEELYANGYSLFIVSTNDDPEVEMRYLNDLVMRSVDGLIVAPCNGIPQLQTVLDETPIPVVFTDRIADEHGDFVGIDDAHEAGRLIDCFSKKPDAVGIIHASVVDVMTIRLRNEGAMEACAKRGIKSHTLALASDRNEAKKQLKQLLDSGVDSLIPLNQLTALDTIGLLKELNVTIPDDVRLISFEDNPAFEYFTPPITALSQPVQEIAHETVNRLLSRLSENTSSRKHLLLNAELIERESH